MVIETRQQQIAAQAEATGRVTVAELALRYDVTPVTIRRDLDELQSAGILQRVRGGAVPTRSRSFEPPFAQRAASAQAAKAAIGAAAAQMVEPGQTVILDVGTTALAVARALHAVRDLTVVTNSLPVANELGTSGSIRTFLTGGELRPGELSLTGPAAIESLRGYNVDLAFIGIAGIRPDHGLTEYNPEDAWVKKAAIFAARAGRAIVVADSSKLMTVALNNVAPLEAVEVLITDLDADPEVIERIAESGVEVIQAPWLEEGPGRTG